jgi:Leucine-rich repeat (LRR) protein
MKKIGLSVFVPVFALLVIALFACGKKSPASPEPAPADTATITMTSTLLPTYSPTGSPTHTGSPTGTPTHTFTATGTQTVAYTATATATQTSTPVVVVFPDSALEAAIRIAISKPSGGITEADLAALTTFEDDGGSIADLTGIEHCVNLQSLSIQYSAAIDDVSMLSTMTQLTHLDLYDSENLSDLTGLETLANLTYLDLGFGGGYSAPLASLAPVSGLTNLTYLNLRSRDIDDTDAAQLSGLTNMVNLNLGSNSSLTSLSFVSGMNMLVELYLDTTGVSDLSELAGKLSLNRLGLRSCASLTEIGPLVTNAAAGGIGAGDTVYLQGTSLSAQGETDVNTLITTYGVTVNYP